MAFAGLNAFSKAFKNFAKEVPRGAQAAIRREAINWFDEVVDLTPVKTGFAAHMWKYTINTRPPHGSIKHPGGESYPAASVPTFYNLKYDDTLYIYNNVAYIGLLEDGYSNQAPANFFKNSARRANRRLQKEFNRLKV